MGIPVKAVKLPMAVQFDQADKNLLASGGNPKEYLFCRLYCINAGYSNKLVLDKGGLPWWVAHFAFLCSSIGKGKIHSALYFLLGTSLVSINFAMLIWHWSDITL